jgi:acyl dehydratase
MTHGVSAGPAAGKDDAGPRVIEQRGLYFDELEEDVIYAHRPGRTVTETDNVLFTTLTMNNQALHLATRSTRKRLSPGSGYRPPAPARAS